MQSLINNKGYKLVFKPWLETKLNQSFPDPSKFTKDEEFLYAAKTASIFKKVIAEILMWVQEKEAAAQYLQAKKEGKMTQAKKFEIGGE